MDVETLKTNNEIFQAIGSLNEGVRGINNHLATLNGSVAKQQDKANNQDILNAQMTITQKQIIDDMKDMKEKRFSMTTFWYSFIASIFVMVLTYFLTKSGL